MKPLRRFRARYFLDKSQDWMFDNLHGPFMLVFDDGAELVTNARETQYSSFGWEFHRRYRDTPLLKEHHVAAALKGNLLNSETHLAMLTTCLWSVYDAYTLPDYMARQLPSQDNPNPAPVPEVVFREQLSKMAYELTNEIYNRLTYHCEEYVGTLDITHFMQLLAHPRVAEANNAVDDTQKSINDAYDVIRDVLRNDASVEDNPLSRAVRSKTVKEDQLLQCIGPRGFLTDVDSFIFRYPVKRGYARGLRSLYDSMVESRSAAISLAFSKTQLQDSEYFSRRLQLVSQIVRNLHMGDCGSTEYKYWMVRGDVFDEGGVKIRDNDLGTIQGKYYVDDDGTMKVVRKSDKHLIGRMLKLRTVLRCRHPDPYGVCSTCFGDLSYSVPAESNLGHMCCTHLTQKISQSVLSLKHINMSSSVDGITLDQYARRFVRTGPDQNSFILNPDLAKADKVTLFITPQQAPGLTDVREVEEVESLPALRVSELETLRMEVTQGTMTEKDILVNVKVKNRSSSFTYAFLDYLKVFGWTIEDGNYVVDMTNWNWTTPILMLPMKQFNMSDQAAAIARMLESTVRDSELRDNATDPLKFLENFHDLVNDKLTVNLAVNEIVVLGISIRSARNYDYRLPKPHTDYGIGVRSNIFAFRSASAEMAFQNQRDFFLSPLSYITNHQRPDHPMDGVLMPAERFAKLYPADPKDRLVFGNVIQQ